MRDNPNLTPKQIDRIRSVALLRSVQAGEVLYEPSQPDVPLFIVLEGNVSISRTGEDDKILAVRKANQFTGEMSVISGKRSLLKARVTGAGRVLELSRDKVLSLMAKDNELGEIFMGGLRRPAPVDDSIRRGKCNPLRDQEFRPHSRAEGIPYTECTPIYLHRHRFRLLRR